MYYEGWEKGVREEGEGEGEKTVVLVKPHHNAVN